MSTSHLASARAPSPLRRTRHALAALMAVVCISDVAFAQPRGSAHVGVGVGATDLNAGMDWQPGAHRMGIGGELGLGNLFVASLGASFHASPEHFRKWDPFMTVAVMDLGSSEFSSVGVAGGVGVVYWPFRRIGVRLDGFRFLPLATERNVPREQQSTAHQWGVRGGVAFALW